MLDAVLSLEKELDFVEKWRGDDGRRFPWERQVESLAVYSNQASNLDLFSATQPNEFAEPLSFLLEF